MTEQNNPEIVLTHLRQKAEELAKSKASRLHSEHLEAEDMKLLHELEVHQIELEMQNEELMRAHKEAQLNAEKYAELFDFAPLGYFIVSDEGNIIGLNLRGAQMLARERSVLLNSSFVFFVTNDTKPIFNRFLDNLFNSGKNEFCEVAFLTKGTPPIFVHLSGIVNGTSREVLITAVDITERKQNEAAMQESEKRYRFMLESSEIGVGVYSLDGKILYYNQKAVRALGGKADDYIGKTLHEIFGEAAASVFVARIQESAESEKSMEYEEFVKLDPGNRWFLSIYSRLTSPDGKVFGVQVIAHDITERKQSEEALRASTQFANSLITSMHDGVSVLDTKGIHIDVNPAFCLMTGFSREELLGNSPAHLYWPPEEYGRIEAAFQKTLANETANYELVFMRKNGERFPVIVSPFAIRDKFGDIVSYSATVKDISERKKVEYALLGINDRLSMTLEVGKAGVWTWDVKSNAVSFDERFHALLGYTNGELPVSAMDWLTYHHPDDVPAMMLKTESCLKGEVPVFESEHRIRSKTGEWNWVFTRGKIIKNELNSSEEFLGIAMNITERKQIENQLQRSLHNLAEAERIGNTGSWEYDVATDTSVWSENMFRIFGVDPNIPKELVNRYFVKNLVHPDDHAYVAAFFRDALAGKNPGNMEFRIIDSADKTRYIHALAEVIRDTDGNPVQMIGKVEDITERKLKDDALKESKIQLELAHRAAGAGTWDWDMISSKLTWSKELFALFGLDPEKDEATFDTWTQVVHPDDRANASDRIEIAIRKKMQLNSEYRVVYADGRVHWICSLGNTIYDNNGEPVRMTGICTDITERRQAQQELQKSEERYRSLLTNLDAGIVVHAPDTTIIMNNRKASELLGLSEDQMRGKLAIDPGWKFIGENNIPLQLAEYPVNRIVATKKSFANQVLGVLRLAATDVVWLAVNGVPVFDVNGEIAEIVISFIDITGRKKAEDALRLKNLVFDASISANSISDVNGIITEANDAFIRIWGFPGRDEVLGMPITGFLLEASDGIEIINALNVHDEWEGEYTAKRKDGTTFNAHGLATTIKDGNGIVIGYQSAVIDITERIQSEIKLKASEEKFKNLVREMQVGVLLQGPQAEIILSNAKALELLGLTENQLLGKTSFDPDWNVIHEDGSPFPGNTHPVPQAIATRLPVREVIMGVYHPLNQERVWLKVDAEPQLNEDGTVRQVVCTFIDISTRKQAEGALFKSEEQFRGLFENSIDSVAVHQVILDDSGNPADYIFLRANAAFEKHTGLRSADITGKRVTEVLPGTEKTPLIGIYGKVALTGEPVTFEQYFEPLQKHFHINAYQVGYGFFVTVFQDITERRRIAEEIKNKNEELEKLNIEKDKFFSIIAHDLRSPFNSLLGLTKMIEEELPSFSPDELQSSISSMRKSAGVVFHLLENLLEWSRMQRGLHSFRPVSFLLSEQLIENMNLVQLASERKNIHIRQQIPDRLAITADLQMFQSLVSNLVFNAVKFTPIGGEVTIAAKEMPDNVIVISVSDNGIGMDKATLDDLFNINRSNYRKGTDGEPSSGLGLVICKDFVEKHGGEIWVESETGKGSTFYFSIPHIPVQEDQKESGNIEPEPKEIARNTKLKILVAEDDETTQMFISLALKPLSREIIKAVTGVEAVNACAKHPDIDLILMDIRMPEMDGYEATRQIRMFNKKVVIMAQTAFIMDNDRKQALEAGCNEFIPKPLEVNLLKGMIQKCFDTNYTRLNY